MKHKRFLKVIAIVITLTIVLITGLVSTTEAQTYVTVAADHDLEVESEYEYFSMEYLATAYFEIKFDIKVVKGTGTEDIEIILSADNDLGDYEVEDKNTFIYYIGDDAYSSSMTTYDTIGTSSGDDLEIPAFTGLFFLAASDDPDWADYTWAGSEIEEITVYLVAGSYSTTDILKIKEYRFEDSPGGNDHDDSQDFSDYDSLSDADWDRLGGAPVIDTSDDTLYLRSTYLACYDPDDPNTYPGAVEICDGKDNDCDGVIPANEADKDEDGFMVCEGDCNDGDTTVYPGAIEICDGKDNNCDEQVDMKGSQGCTIYYKDEDHDGQGLDGESQCLCSPDETNKYTATYSGDPDDLDPNIQGTILTGNMSLPAGWSMISLPLTPDNASVSSLFSDAVVVYGYEKGKGYVRIKQEENMEVRVGYWILLNEAKTYTITGEIIDWYNLTVQDGWYMIGGCTSDAKASVDEGKIKVIYGYNRSSGYQRILNSEKLEPSKGYWILLKDITEKAQLNVGIPNIKGQWVGNWEAYLIDLNGLITDPNGQSIITMSGDIRFHVTDQETTTNMSVSGTIEIMGWDVDPQPQSWPGNWTGESDEVILTGWIDEATRFLRARYFYYPGQESSANYNENEDYKNIKGFYIWMFNTNKLKISDTGISGEFSITGTDGYYEIGAFSVEREDAQYL